MVPEDWGVAPLGELADVVMGQAPPSAVVHEGVTRGLPFIQGNAEFGVRYPTPNKSCSEPSKVAEPGDILISVRAPVGALNRAHLRLAIGRGLAALRVRGMDANYTWYAVQHNVGQLSRLSQGSTFQAINKEALSTLSLMRPPVGEQRKIAAILSSVDDAIEATQAVIDQLQVVKKAMMAELLTRGLPGRHTRFKQTEIGEVPEEWALVTIEALGPETGPTVRSGPFGSSMKTKDFHDTGTPVLTIQSLGEGVVLAGGLFYVNEAKAAELREYEVRPNDLVFSRVADIGRCVAIGEAEEGWLISSNLTRIRLDPQKADARFLMYSLTAQSPVRRKIQMITGDAGRPVISSGTLKTICLPLPTIEEQRHIVAGGRQLEDRITKETDMLQGLRSAKSALMSVLLTGDVRVTPDKAAA